MSAPPFMKLYIAEYLADTTHLTRGEHGAYLLLIMAIWRGGGKIPRDPVKLAKIAKATPEEWPEIWASIGDLFSVRGGSLTQGRVRKERAVYDNVVRQASEAGKASAAKRAKENKRVASTKSQRNGNEKEEEAEDNNRPLQGAIIISALDAPVLPLEGKPAPPLRVVEKPASPRDDLPPDERAALVNDTLAGLGSKKRVR